MVGERNGEEKKQWLDWKKKIDMRQKGKNVVNLIFIKKLMLMNSLFSQI